MVDHALKIEADYEDRRSRNEGKIKVVQSGRFGKKSQQFTRRNTRGRPYPPNLRIPKSLPGIMDTDQRLNCTYCGRDNHTTAKCYRKKNVCMKCGKPGHWVRDCPMIKPEDCPKTQGQVFALTKQEAKAFTSVIRGTISICDINVKVLIDPRSSHSFVVPHFVCYMNVAPTCLNYTLVVCTPVGGSMETDIVYRRCKLTIDGCDLPMDLIPLDIQDFDVILGMDWLFTHHATVNYHEKWVTFKCPDQAEIHFRGIRGKSTMLLISAIWASHLLANECEGYLAYVVENRGVQTQLEGIPVVKEYREVFPEELLSLPPGREIKFEIKVVPGTASIFKASYRMAPVELKELKEQL
ncbi:uncharacterized protein LOC110007560 [Amborella trichopoda]|uniref:uncharacterized protein LOC110007560 n=1 Tax=Amborella trichopoda TaxID=13333 RepID=UPI0009BD0339|nr:uncharacterized protein LOC110007560 [Amborella trichopoda]|eukprot:XP_020524782.1 uncharacterized protein LOC110007560 [Amborella trichopoda]